MTALAPRRILSQPMDALDILLGHGLDRHGSDVGAMGGFGNRQRIVMIIFVATYKRFDVLCGQKLNLMAV